MMQIANILPGQWQRYARYNYAVWVHRFARALDTEIKQLPEKPPPLPWPVYQKPERELRAVNDVLYPKSGPQFTGKPKPSARQYLSSYVPRFVNESQARTEVYRGEDGDNFQLRIKQCWDHPRPWSIEGVVDPGSTVYLPFFREVTIRIPLKAKVCRELNATKDGRWVGKCSSVKKLNAPEQIASSTQWIMENGQSVAIDSGQLRVDSARAKAADRSLANGQQLTADSCASGSAPAAHGSLVMPKRHPHPASPTGRGVSPGLAAYRAKVAAHEQRAVQSRTISPRYLADERYRKRSSAPGGGRDWRPGRFDLGKFEQEREELIQAELEIMGVMLRTSPDLNNPFLSNYNPPFLQRDDLDGYLVTKKEVGPDPHHCLLPEPCYRTLKWWRGYGRWGGKGKRYLTARERLAQVKPSLKIVPTGPRSSELIITRRMHELSIGLAEALHLARMIEGAIKYRDPPKPDRKQSWRQELRSRLINDAGRFIWLIRNPINAMDSGKGRRDNDGSLPLNLGPVDPEVLRNLKYRPRPKLTELFPEAGMPKQYLELVDRGWMTQDPTYGPNLLRATPIADFATKVEGFPLRLPVAVMPPAAYERWLAKSRIKPRRRRRRRTRNRAGCSCSFRPPVFRAVSGPKATKDAFFLRN